LDTPRTSASPWVTVALGLIVLLGLGEGAQLYVLHKDAGGTDLRAIDSVARGSLCSLLLVNGQMYYGTLVEAQGGFVRLEDAYEVHSQPQGSGPPLNQLVNRRKADWHAPEWMAIPVEKILFIEKVGPDSQVARLIRQDRSNPGTK
jgi:hypothetical protein